MAKISNLIFDRTTTWTAPAGVTYVNVTPIYDYNNFVNGNLLKTIDGILYAWGTNSSGQVGDNTTSNKSSPTLVLGNLNVFRLSKNTNNPISSTCGVITTNGDAYAWGANNVGYLGDGTITAKSSPVLIQGNLRFVDMSIRDTTSVGITAQGQVYAWGRNNNGQLGVNDTTARSSPTLVVGNLTFSQLPDNTNLSHTLGLTTNGALYAWGSSAGGALGVGDNTPRSSPTLVSGGLTYVKAYMLTGSYCFGITNTGDTYAWGSNGNGQLGLGDVTPRSSPVLISGGLKFVDIRESSGNSAIALDDKGDAYGWGINTSGQLGVNDDIPKSSPTLVVGGLKFKKISTGNGNNYGLTNNGTLYAWGINNNGQLGDGTTTTRSSPVLVSGGLTFVEIFGKTNSAYAITNNGLLYAWGLNSTGQLGDGTITAKSSPVLVQGNLVVSPVSGKGIQNMQIPTRVSVVPGTTYNVTFNNAGYTTINNVPVSFGPLKNLIFSYEQ